MDNRKFSFVENVLGERGAVALKKAAERSKPFENVIVPRTILAWLGVYARSDFEGSLPGVEDSYLSFTKSESTYSGVISIGEQNYSFDRAPLFHLASAIAVALGIEEEQVDPALQALDLAYLGKSIDVLAKAQAVSKNRAEELEKGQELPGMAAAPKEAAGPLAPKAPVAKNPGPKKPSLRSLGQPTAPEMQAPTAVGPSVHAPATATAHAMKTPKIPKIPAVKLTLSEAAHKCPVCERSQFRGDNLIGCICFRDLSKAAHATLVGSNYVITFGPDWDEEAVSVFLESVGRK